MACDLNHDTSLSIQSNTDARGDSRLLARVNLVCRRDPIATQKQPEGAAFSYLGQQPNHARRVAKIGKENVRRMLLELVEGVLA